MFDWHSVVKVATAENIRGIPNTTSLPQRAIGNEECDDEREGLVIHCNFRKTVACESFRRGRKKRVEKDGESLLFVTFNAILSKL